MPQIFQDRPSIRNLSLLLMGGFLLLSCSVPPPGEKPDPQTIAAHSSQIPREGLIQVEFTSERGTGGQTAPEGLLTLDPPVPGVARWADSRTLEFLPARPLGRGMRYRALLNMKALQSPDPKVYEFPLRVVQGDFTLEWDELAWEAGQGASAGLYTLAGRILTEDKELPDAVEKILEPRLGGQRVGIRWTHGEKEHAFVLGPLARSDRDTTLEVLWRGGDLGQKKDGRKDFLIPGSETFRMLDSRPVPGAASQLEVVFSDPLDPAQDLKGLIHIPGRSDLKTQVQNNRVQVFASRPFLRGDRLVVEAGVRNTRGQALGQGSQQPLAATTEKPQLRFAGPGTILPDTQGLIIPVETLNISGLKVQALKVFSDNMPQYLQVNNLGGRSELHRVGQVVWEQVVNFDFKEGDADRWVRRGLDLSALVKNHPDGMFQITISFRQPQIVWPGYKPPEPGNEATAETPPREYDYEYDYDYYYEDYEESYEIRQRKRQDPTEDAYYGNSQFRTTDRKMVLVSNIGLSAKKDGNGNWYFFASDLKTTSPLGALDYKVLDFQRRELASGKTDAQGMAVLPAGKGVPAFLLADMKGQKGYLRLQDSDRLDTSSFATAGEGIQKGLKGFIYGERGVWRPGDPLFLTFLLQDGEGKLPPDHPVTMELWNPRGQRKDLQTLTRGTDGFYAFKTGTAQEDPTGDWEVRVRVGDAVFEKTVKIAAIMPNRLKVELKLNGDAQELSGPYLKGTLVSSWLHGAPSSGLKADVKAGFSTTPTLFPAFPDFTFDDPARKFSNDFSTIFEGELDQSGKAAVEYELSDMEGAPGKLKARFALRVFEQSGAFSMEEASYDYHPHSRYVGLRLPAPDTRWGMYYTDKEHKADIILVDTQGKPVESGTVEVEFFEVGWWWWWESRENALADYVENNSYTPVKKETVTLRNGKGTFSFRLNGREWGQYLIRVRDSRSTHSTGQTLYMGWEGWSYRSERGGPALLSLTPEKDRVQVGENIRIAIPSAPQGRALAVVEARGKVISRQWLEGKGSETILSFPATPDMAPNIYVHVSYLQPHLQTANDLPIRLYGITGVEVYDPGTKLEPVVEAPGSLLPLSSSKITVREARGRPMTFTLAVVDEGLLRISGFRVPEPWKKFYAKEASQIGSWDLYSFVAGAWSGKLESLLGIGGSDDLEGAAARKPNRFPPVVRFYGPITLGAGAVHEQTVDIPNYMGSVRLMVVAAKGRSYGSVEKEVPVRSDVMVFGTLPRVLSTGEEVDLPVSVFNFTSAPGPTLVNLEVQGPVKILGAKTQTLRFTQQGELLAKFRLQVDGSPGTAKVKITAQSGAAASSQDIELEVRIPGVEVSYWESRTLDPGKTWEGALSLPGADGTNKVQLEVTQLVPMELSRNLEYLINYPYGCIEQTVSSVFPQLYLDKLLKLDQVQSTRLTQNLNAAVRRLKTFQTPSGGLAYWPGEQGENEWGTTYAFHYLLEAEDRGIAVDQGFLDGILDYQRTRASTWTEKDSGSSSLVQAYRLFTLALAGAPDQGAMNRLAESPRIDAQTRWRLAQAYSLAGRTDQAKVLSSGLSTEVPAYTDMEVTYGSGYRDEAMILETLVNMGLLGPAKTVADRVARAMNSWSYYSTQSLSYGLMALAKYNIAVQSLQGPMEAQVVWLKEAPLTLKAKGTIEQRTLVPQGAGPQNYRITNTGTAPLYAQFMAKGITPPGRETAYQNGLKLEVAYYDPETYYLGYKSALSPEDLSPGQDVLTAVSVTNTKGNRLTNLALNYLVPGSWEILKNRDTPQAIPQSRNSWYGSYWDRERPHFDFQDIRDDRVLTFFSLQRGESKTFVVQSTLTYGGKFYLPPVSVEAMYDPAVKARVPGRWLEGKSTSRAPEGTRRPGGRVLE